MVSLLYVTVKMALAWSKMYNQIWPDMEGGNVWA